MNAAFTCAMICLNAAARLWHGFAAKENAINQNCHIGFIDGGMMGARYDEYELDEWVMLKAKNIRYLVVHCADTPDDQPLDASDIHQMHLVHLL